MAIGCLAALREAGHSVPEDFALVGFDDIPIARYTAPPLTSVRVSIAELGPPPPNGSSTPCAPSNGHRRLT